MSAHCSSNSRVCPKCKSPISEILRYCPSCGDDLGCPNVRAAKCQAEILALADRYRIARMSASTKGVEQEFDALSEAVRQASHVVVAMPPLYARTFLRDTRTLYANYEALVGTPARVPAPFEQDSERRSVAAKIFAGYANHIRYGVLSLDGKSLSSYGIVFVCLKDIAVQDRVTFLHENSYIFLKSLASTAQDPIPPGFRSDWENKDKLAATKLEPKLVAGSALADWSQQLVVLGKTRSEDQCIEAHIFGPFNASSVSTVLVMGKGISHEEKIDIRLIQDHLGHRCRIEGGP